MSSDREPVTEPALDCLLCPRLAVFREQARRAEPAWHNAPVKSFGDMRGHVLVVGLAPGLKGANRTGRPFTGDFAGDLLYGTLSGFGFSKGHFDARSDDGLVLIDTLVTNAVRCVPPQNKPTPVEISTCRTFLTATIAAMSNLSAIVALGRIAHDSVIRAWSQKLAAFPFAHGARHRLLHVSGRLVTLHDSYHCSRYNTNTGVLTPEMFRGVFAGVRKDLDAKNR